MNLLAPSALIFLLTLPVIIVFYLLKRRRVEKVVSSTLLWERFLAESQANAPFQKLRKHLLMFLQLLLAFLMVMALTRPYFQGQQKTRGLNIILVDASGSMMSRDESPTRFEKARGMARQIIEGMTDGASATLIRMGPRAEVVQSSTSRKGLLLAALDRMKPSTGPAASTEALQLAESLVRNPSAFADAETAQSIIPESQIHIISDGGIDGLDELATRNLPLSFHPVGNRISNVAITSVDARPSPEAPGRQIIFVQLENASDSPVTTVMSLYFNDDEVTNRPVEIEANSEFRAVFEVEQRDDGIYRVTLNHEDDLPADNTAWIISRLPGPVRVLLVSTGNAFLEKALSSIQNVTLSRQSTFPSSGTEDEYDAIISDGVAPEGDYLVTDTLWINAVPQTWFPEPPTELEAPVITSADPDHPALRFVSLDQLLVARASNITMPPWASPVVQSTSTPLIIEGELDGHRQLWIGFDILESNWPRLVSFPIFMANVVSWLSEGGENSDLTSQVTGSTLQFRPEPAATAKVTFPDGNSEVIEPDPSTGQIYLSRTDTPGVYSFVVETNRIDIAVNAIHRSESLVRPAASIRLGEVMSIQGSDIQEAQKEIWPWILLGVLMIASFEWWYFHRRTA
jgi:hypothetical protein